MFVQELLLVILSNQGRMMHPTFFLFFARKVDVDVCAM